MQFQISSKASLAQKVIISLWDLHQSTGKVLTIPNVLTDLLFPNEKERNYLL